ncbi:Ig-like domain-containing protein, partial [Pseudoscardovia suis]|uniref:Ig-like domain-containing protein n=1 Tax=Pseudoscardovia suis TaxID=987063 RepID=UPI003F97E7EA
SVSLTVGGSQQLSATVAPSNATDKTVTWKSSDSSVAMVNANGLVKAVKVGTATITASSSNGKTATATVTVTTASVAVTGVSVSPSSLSLTVGNSQQLSATVSPSNATDKTVSWKSSDSSVATVDANGLVKAVKAGSATITVSSANGKTASVSVVVKAAGTVTVPVSMVSVSGSKTVSVGSTTHLSATVSPSNATNKTVVWGSTDPKVATVSSDGMVTGVAKGTARIVATAGNVSAAFDVSVKAAESMTVWYRPDSAVSGVRMWYPTASGSAGSVDMAKAADG